ncbi:MAG TPA: tetratricopeptide repeat protein [Thermoanaerobaculia bacterium]|nr:tetratricopeptide repeat protein [Thermoanaerobaculia bacterium]
MAQTREQVVQAAEKYVARGKIEPAIREYRKLLADHPNDINTLNRIGDLYARIQRIDEAVDFFTQIAEQYTAEGFFVKAIAIYKKIIKLDPTRLEVYEQLAELYHKQGLVTEARTQYQVLADYYVKHQNAASAIAIYQKMVQLEPENPTYHVKLAEIYHQQQLIEKAMGEYRIIAELMIQHGRPQEAAQVYERALDIDSQNLGFIQEAAHNLRAADHAEGAAHFLAVAVERNPQAEQVARRFREDRAAAPVAAAPQPDVEPDIEADVELEVDMGFEIEAEPEPLSSPGFGAILGDDDLDFSLDDDDGDDLARAMAEAAAAVGGDPAPAVADPESEEIELDLDDMFEVDLPGIEEEEQPSSLVKPPADMLGAPARPAWSQETTPVPGAAFAAPPAAPEEKVEEIELELDLYDPFASVDQAGWTTETPPWLAGGEDQQPAEEAPSAAFAAAPAWQVEEEAAPARAEPEREEDLDLVTEAEVLAKYGLEDKAMERLNEALRLRPDHLQAYTLLIQISLEKGRHTQIVDLANQMSEVALRKGKAEPWQKVRKKLVDAGYRFDGDLVVATPQAVRTAGRPAEKVDDLLQSILGGPTPKTPRAPARPAAVPPPAAPPPSPEPAFLEPELPELPAFVPEPLPFAPPPAAPAPAPSRSVFDPLQIGELVESEAEDWSALDVPLPSAAPPRSVTDQTAMLDDTGSMSWLDEADRHRDENQVSAAEIFDEEDDFFDLAGELVEELSREEVFQRDGVTIQSEQSLEEIVEGFKKGVAEHLSPTDYDTHFNLGIAYREMGLLDEAIGEFQLAAKDASHLVLCCSMLGLCFLDKGLPDLAIKWYRRALEAPSLSEEDQLGMLYDLGNVYMQTGDNASAYNTFAELYGVDANYRDVTAKLEELAR